MNKSDAAAAGSAPGRLIDQAVSRGLTALQRGTEVGNAVADVMNARTALRQKLGDWTRGVAGLEQLDVDGTEPQADDGGAVRGFRMPGSKAQDVAVKGKGFGDAGNGDADMSD